MKITIKGHSTRGKEVIQILESLGGVNDCPLNGNAVYTYYYIDYDCNNIIHCHDMKYVNECCKKYTLEEFEKEFPFKIGDKVSIVGFGNHSIIALEYFNNELCYKLDNGFHYDPKTLTTYKEMKEERNITLTLDKAKEWYKKGGELREIALQAFTEKELTKVDLPKTWKEFCDNYPVQKGECWLGGQDRIFNCVVSDGGLYRQYKNWISSQKSAEAHLAMIQLEQLRDCWRQGWKPTDCDTGYCITHYSEEYLILSFNFISFLSFPTKKMAEEFLECFRDLIEKAGDLI